MCYSSRIATQISYDGEAGWWRKQKKSSKVREEINKNPSITEHFYKRSSKLEDEFFFLIVCHAIFVTNIFFIRFLNES